MESWDKSERLRRTTWCCSLYCCGCGWSPVDPICWSQSKLLLCRQAAFTTRQYKWAQAVELCSGIHKLACCVFSWEFPPDDLSIVVCNFLLVGTGQRDFGSYLTHMLGDVNVEYEEAVSWIGENFWCCYCSCIGCGLVRPTSPCCMGGSKLACLQNACAPAPMLGATELAEGILSCTCKVNCITCYCSFPPKSKSTPGCGLCGMLCCYGVPDPVPQEVNVPVQHAMRGHQSLGLLVPSGDLAEFRKRLIASAMGTEGQEMELMDTNSETLMLRTDEGVVGEAWQQPGPRGFGTQVPYLEVPISGEKASSSIDGPQASVPYIELLETPGAAGAAQASRPSLQKMASQSTPYIELQETPGAARAAPASRPSLQKMASQSTPFIELQETPGAARAAQASRPSLQKMASQSTPYLANETPSGSAGNAQYVSGQVEPTRQYLLQGLKRASTGSVAQQSSDSLGAVPYLAGVSPEPARASGSTRTPYVELSETPQTPARQSPMVSQKAEAVPYYAQDEPGQPRCKICGNRNEECKPGFCAFMDAVSPGRSKTPPRMSPRTSTTSTAPATSPNPSPRQANEPKTEPACPVCSTPLQGKKGFCSEACKEQAKAKLERSVSTGPAEAARAVPVSFAPVDLAEAAEAAKADKAAAKKELYGNDD